MRLAELGVARRGVVDSRRMQFADQRCRQQTLAVELAFAQMQPHPVREVGDRGVDRAGRGSADRQAHGRQPCILVHHVRPRRFIGSFKIVQTEADGHAEPICQPSADERLKTLSAEAFDEQTRDVVAEVVVLPGSADIAAQFEMPHDTEHFGGRPIARKMHPVMARQPRLMAQQVAHRDPLGRDRVVQAKLGHVVAHRFGPVEPPLMVQQRDGGRGERFGDRADHELRRRRNRQVRLDIALTISPRQRHLAILHHGECNTRHLPIGHDIGDEMIEIGDKRGNRRGGRLGR